MEKQELLAAIDVGTNSFHIVIAQSTARGLFKILSRDKETVRLGDTASDMKYITPEAMSRGVMAMKRFAKMAENMGAHITAIATSAVREAQNSKMFVQEVYNETGIRVEVISGQEEARLIYLGVLQALPLFDEKILVLDIGGGSTEIAIGLRGKMKAMFSHKLGAIRLSRRFFPKERFSAKDLRNCREYISGEIAQSVRSLKKTGFRKVIGCSGTIQTLVSIIKASDPGLNPESLNGCEIKREEVSAAVAMLIKQRSYKKRAAIPGMDAKRVDIILGGVLIVEQVMEALGARKLSFSEFALREGILLDTIRKKRDIRKYHHLSRLRYESVMQLCEHCGVDLKHAGHVKGLALRLFDDLLALHGLGDTERELLEAATYLHDVGYHISPDRHHHHSYYIIRNTSLLGFTNDETEIIANIARYHRKSHPKPKHNTFQKLPDEYRGSVKLLAGILRIAEGLDRRHLQNVESLATRKKGRKLEIRINPKTHAPAPDIEIWGAERKLTLLEEALGLKIHIRKEASPV